MPYIDAALDVNRAWVVTYNRAGIAERAPLVSGGSLPTVSGSWHDVQTHAKRLADVISKIVKEQVKTLCLSGTHVLPCVLLPASAVAVAVAAAAAAAAVAAIATSARLLCFCICSDCLDHPER